MLYFPTSTNTSNNNVAEATKLLKQPLSSAYSDAVKLYDRGGELDTSIDKIANQGKRRALGSAMTSLVSTGMSSGSNAVGALARVQNDADLLRAQGTLGRIGGLSQALQLKARAEDARRARLSSVYLTGEQLMLARDNADMGVLNAVNARIASNDRNYMLAKASGLDTWGMPHS